jgi:hypothetical protein
MRSSTELLKSVMNYLNLSGIMSKLAVTFNNG